MKQNRINKQVKQDADQVKKGLSNLAEDETVQMNKFKDNLIETAGKAKDNLTTWVEDSTSQFSEGFEELTGKARETVVDAAAVVKKDVGQGLSQYNAKAQKVADKVPGDFGVKAAQYPWVAISIALAVGFLLGSLLKPTRQSTG